MSSENKEKRYVICPVCNEINPAENKFCEHCWGAALNQSESYSEEELKLEHQRRAVQISRKKKIRLGILGGLGAVILALVILFIVNYTDVISSPQENLNSNPLNGDWSMFRHDVLHSGSAGTNDRIPEGKLKWSFTTGGEVHSSPTIAEGKVFIGSRDYYMYALEVNTGDLEWKFKTGSRVDSSATVVDGTVYFGSNDSILYALDTDTAETIWEFDTEYPVRSSAAVANDLLYFGSDDYYLYAVDKDTGKQKWKFDTDSPAGSSPVIQDGLLAYGSAGGYSFVLNAESGQRRLKYNPGGTVYASATIDNGIVYFLTTNGVIAAVDGTARTWLWEHDIRPYWAQAWAMINWLPKNPDQSGFLWHMSLHKPNPSTPVIEDSVMYVGVGHSLVAVDLENKQILWEFDTGDSVRSSAAKAGPVVYIGNESGYLYAVNADTGELRWKFKTGAEIASSPAVVDGIVYVGSYDGKVYAIE
ncbi:MAG: PQQ-binding-like beta-propeller repeat protein [Dehalococcoidales bacterium]|nr:PQQ-binding-like beta-propeller repeat protein [Dehalococcoidales bacterium]